MGSLVDREKLNMLGFQVLTFFFVMPFFLTFLFLVRSRSGLITGGGAFVTFSILISIITFVLIDPEISQIFANYIGVGRGVDLVLYLSIFFLLFLIFLLYLRIQLLKRQIEIIIRELALMHVIYPEES